MDRKSNGEEKNVRTGRYTDWRTERRLNGLSTPDRPVD